MDRENKKEEIYSEAVRAGKRTYFFDVKSTKKNDYYLTITESKKKYSENGESFYEKHKLFLYKEDFEKFIEGLQNVVKKIDGLDGSPQSIPAVQASSEVHKNGSTDNFTDINFEDLDK
ncbi:MAG: DUF3276 family protein [Bacteroidia bacterium]